MNSLTNFFRTALDTVFPEAFETLGEQERRNLDRIKQKLTENLKSNPSTYLSFDSVDNPIGFITTMLGEDALQDLRPFPESDKLREIVEAFLIESLTTKELLIDVANYRGTKFDSLFNKIITIKNLTGAHFEAAITELESASGNISAYRSRFEKNISQRADLASFYAEYQKAAAPRKEAARELIQLITGENKDLEKIANIFKNGNLTGRVLESEAYAANQRKILDRNIVVLRDMGDSMKAVYFQYLNALNQRRSGQDLNFVTGILRQFRPVDIYPNSTPESILRRHNFAKDQDQIEFRKPIDD